MKAFVIVGATMAALGLLPLVVIVLPFFAGLATMLVGWVFPYITDTIRELAGVNLTDFQLGATLGFFGSFFRSPNINNND